MDQPELGKKILQLRLLRGLTQAELADKSKIGLRTIQRIESGVVTPRSYTIKLIFSVLQYDDSIFQHDKPTNKSKMARIYKISLIVSFIAITLGVMFKIMHYPGSSYLMTIGGITSLIFIIIALTEIYKSEKKSLIEFFLWLLAFILLTVVTGLVYYYTEIKKRKTI